MKIMICGRCAYESVTRIKPVNQKSEKATCMLCGRRRFCLLYDVKGKGDEPAWQNR